MQPTEYTVKSELQTDGFLKILGKPTSLFPWVNSIKMNYLMQPPFLSNPFKSQQRLLGDGVHCYLCMHVLYAMLHLQ